MHLIIVSALALSQFYGFIGGALEFHHDHRTFFNTAVPVAVDRASFGGAFCRQALGCYDDGHICNRNGPLSLFDQVFTTRCRAAQISCASFSCRFYSALDGVERRPVDVVYGWQLLSWILCLLSHNFAHLPTAQSSFRTFIMLRAGDVSFLSGIALAYHLYGTIEFKPLFEQALPILYL